MPARGHVGQTFQVAERFGIMQQTPPTSGHTWTNALVLSVNHSTWWSATAANNDYAPFDQPFHVLLNLAVGGYWPGTTPPDPAGLPYQMLVDYIRVYDVTCPAPGSKELSCSDGIDNDCDGLIDAYDPDCAGVQ